MSNQFEPGSLRPVRPLMTLIMGLAMILLVANPALAKKRIAISFDDIPRGAGEFFTPDQRSQALLAGLKRSGVKQAGFFVTVGNLNKPDGEGGEARITAYANAGHIIANHSFSHKWLRDMSAADYLADIDLAEVWLKGRPGYRPWFRFPFLGERGKDREQRDAVRAGLRQRGLLNAYITIDNYDWYLDSLANTAKREGKAMDLAALRTLYVETIVASANFYDRIALKTLGRSPVHVLLLHETDLNGQYIADLVKGLRTDGWTIATMDEAYADPIAAIEPDTSFLGEGRVAAFAFMTGMKPIDLVYERTDEDVLKTLFNARVLKEKVIP